LESEIEYDILAYLSNNPEAGDTVEGIIEWWLLEQRIKSETEKVKSALSRLVAKGLIVENKRKSSGAYYRVNRRKYGKIKSILKDRSQ